MYIAWDCSLRIKVFNRFAHVYDPETRLYTSGPASAQASWEVKRTIASEESSSEVGTTVVIVFAVIRISPPPRLD